MKSIKLYNVIFPIWVIMFLPPPILLMLIGNFIIDSIVLISCYYFYKLGSFKNLKPFFKKTILAVWIFGFIADFCGALFLFLICFISGKVGLVDNIVDGILSNPFSNIMALLIILIAMFISSLLIFIFNYKSVFNKVIGDINIRFKVSMLIAIITTPWTFLIPTKLFY